MKSALPAVVLRADNFRSRPARGGGGLESWGVELEVWNGVKRGWGGALKRVRWSLEEGSSISFSGKTAFHRITILTIFCLICLLLGVLAHNSQLWVLGCGIHDQLSILSTYQTKDYLREKSSMLKLALLWKVAPQLLEWRHAHSWSTAWGLNTQHWAERQPAAFLFYSKYLLFDRTPSVLLEDGTWLSCCGNLYSGSKNGIIKPGQGILKPTTFLFHSSLSLRRKKLLIWSFGESLASDGLRICSCMQRIIIKHHHHHPHNHYDPYHLIFWC